MEKPEISYRVLKVGEFGDKDPSIYYKVICSCTDNRDTLDIVLDHDWDCITLTLSQKLVWSSHWGMYPWYERIWYRITSCIKMLFMGYTNVEGSVMLQGEEHVQGFIDALEEGKLFIRKHNEKEKKLNEKL